MPFSSLLFLSAFLPAFLALYFLSPRLLKNGVALAFSIVFYAWGAPRLLPVVLALGVIDYLIGNAIANARRNGHNQRAKQMLVAVIVLHVSVLAYFKYSNFLVAQTNATLATFAAHFPSSSTIGPIAWREVPLPIGISFLTFEEISYVVDVYRGNARPAKSLRQYLLFLMLFPHSIAGPIFRWKDLEAQLAKRTHSIELITAGFGRFAIGLVKKVLVADAAALAVDPVFAANSGVVPPSMAWLAALAYALQIYFDFSGYSDMAIGLGQMAGFQFKENFNAPYQSASITEFWKRWHISLSTWLRDYLYVPLGGNRHGERRTRIHILIVFALSGLWHGAAWTFVVWGVYHGLLSIAERTNVVRRFRAALPHIANVALTFLLVVIGWVFFRAPSFAIAVRVFRAMFMLTRPSSFFFSESEGLLPVYWGQLLPVRSAVILSCALIVLVLGALMSEDRKARLLSRLRIVGVVLMPVALLLVLAQLVNSGFTPLIYFKF